MRWAPRQKYIHCWSKICHEQPHSGEIITVKNKTLQKPNKSSRPSKPFDSKPKKSFFRDQEFEEKPKQTAPRSLPLTIAKQVRNEMKIYGVNAAKTTFKKRPEEIFRVYIDKEKVKDFTVELKQCAKLKIAYKLVTPEDLAKVTESTHHEGICVLARKKSIVNFKKFLFQNENSAKHSCVVALENVQNPHNVGAILRVCANFGVDALLLEEPQLALSGSVFRTSEGGAECVPIIETGELTKALDEFKKQGYTIFATSSHRGKALEKTKFPAKTLILFGSESEGLSSQLMKSSNELLCIPQTGHVESLNVSCAASVILYERFKQL